MDGGRWTGHFRGLYVNMLVFSCQTEFLANFATAVLNVGRTVSSLSGSRVNELLGAGPVVLARRDEVSERDPGGPCLTGAKVCMDEGDDFDTIVNHGKLGVGHWPHVELGGNGMCDVGIKIGEALEVPLR